LSKFGSLFLAQSALRISQDSVATCLMCSGKYELCWKFSYFSTGESIFKIAQY